MNRRMQKIEEKETARDKKREQKFVHLDKCFNDSNILDQNQRIILRRLLLELPVKTVAKLYRAAPNSFESSKFHAQCDNKGPTVTIIRMSNGRTVGGVTMTNWDSSNSYKADHKAFLFSIDTACKFPIVKNQANAIYCHSGYGPTFGNGHDLHVSNACNANNNSYSSKGYAYELPAATLTGQSVLGLP